MVPTPTVESWISADFLNQTPRLGGPVFGRAIEVAVGNSVGRQGFAEQGQHGDELAKNEHPVAAVHGLLKQFTQQLDRGLFDERVFGVLVCG